MSISDIPIHKDISKLPETKVSKELAKHNNNNNDHYNHDIKEHINKKDHKKETDNNILKTKILNNENIKWCILELLGPIFLTFLSFRVRFQEIDKNRQVVWDEAHFGKFGSYYIKHEFYHDVHPPLGKMLIALSEWLAGFDGHFDFESNLNYPDNVNFKFMRQFNAMFGVLCTPLAFFSSKWMGLNYWSIYLITLMVTLEHSFIVLSKFILLDSMLLFFIALSFACMCKLYDLRDRQMTREWSLWMLLTGISLGCVCSVKWVGLFITSVIGLYTVLDLSKLYYDKRVGRIKYVRHWLVRIIDLIIVPFLIYLFCFKIHFSLLYKSGTGDASTNTLFQVNLEGTKIENSPRNVLFGSQVTIRSHGLSPNLLHSHPQLYPDGSGQRQITGYGHSDSNNVWEIQFSRRSIMKFDDNKKTSNGQLLGVGNGSLIRLVHNNTRSNLHSHEIPSHVSRGNYEVSGYGDDINGDSKDDWVIEIVDQLYSANPDFHEENPDLVHPISTFFRLKHADLGCYLATTGLAYPNWGFSQAEIVCKQSWSSRDKSTWWNIEDHWNDNLGIEDDYVPPKSKFWTDFILINFAMASSNNALIPDPDKYDRLASKAWEWPTLHRGLRMNHWGMDQARYFMMGSPFNTWISTLFIILFPISVLTILIKQKRQTTLFTEEQWMSYIIQGIFPFISWLANYLPFVVMGRVTYVHHYAPALYFAIILFGSTMNYYLEKSYYYLKIAIYLILFTGCIYIYIKFSPICQGMIGPMLTYDYLKWLSSWEL